MDRPGLVPSWLLEETSRKLGTKEMEQKLGIQSNYDLMPKERQELQEKIQSMVNQSSRSRYRNVKHLLVDEMQDYTRVQYAVIASLFKCNKTINPYTCRRPQRSH